MSSTKPHKPTEKELEEPLTESILADSKRINFVQLVV